MLSLVLGARQTGGARYLEIGILGRTIIQSGAVKRECQAKMDKEVERDFAGFRFSNGLLELAVIAPTVQEAVVALANKNILGVINVE